MAASQARLLSLTARIHDVEYQAQSIQNAKVQLATQSDQVYNEYVAALDAQTLTVAMIDNGQTSRVTANFNNLFSTNRVTPSDGSVYGLRNERGLLVVESAVYDAYNQYQGQDAFAFATAMLGGEMNAATNTDSIIKAKEEAIYDRHKADKETESKLAGYRKALTDYVGEDKDIYDDSSVPEDKKEAYEGTLQNYRDELYRLYGKEICTEKIELDNVPGNDASMAESQYDTDKFNFFINLFNQIKMCGGCVPISDYNGSFGDAANNSEWLTSMIQCGKFTIETFEKDKNGKYTMNTTSPSSDTCIGYTEVSAVDSTAVKKAEAKYEKSLKDIDKKDKAHDMTLSKLETERQALTTEYDSVKKVISDNIDRTFGIFS